MSSKMQVNVQQWQLYNPLNKSTKAPEMPPSRKLPYSKSTGVLKEKLHQPKVSSVGVAPPRKSMDINELNVMLVGNSVAELDDFRDDSNVIARKKIPAPDQTTVVDPVEKQKMPAILNSEGTAAKPSFALRAKPPPMPRSKLKQRKNARVIVKSIVDDETVHTTTPVPDMDGVKHRSVFLTPGHDSSEYFEASKSVVSIEITDSSASPVRSVDEMIQALRSSRQASATEKSMSDKKIDEIMKQVMSHAQEWMEETIPKDDGTELTEELPQSSAGYVATTPAIEETNEPVDDNEVDVSDTVSTLASQISAPAGIPDVKAILARKSSHALRRPSASETSSPAMMVVEDDESVDLEQAEFDFNRTLDVQNHDIIAVQGSHPPLIEKPAFPKPIDDVLARGGGDDHHSFSVGGRMHRLCLLPSIDELNVTSKELALSNFTHSNPFSGIRIKENLIKAAKHKANPSNRSKKFSSSDLVDKEITSSIFDTSKLDPLDIDGWKKLVEGAIEDIDYTLAGSGTDPAKVSAWRLLWSTVPPKMALSTSAVKALVFPYYHGSQIIEDEVTEKESWTEDDELSQIIIDEGKKIEFSDRTIKRRHASVENLSCLYEDRDDLDGAAGAGFAADVFDKKEKSEIDDGKVSREEGLEEKHFRRSQSLPNLSRRVAATASLHLMKTDYTTAMDVLKHQRELALRQQISEQHLKDESIVPQPSASIQVPVSAKQEKTSEPEQATSRTESVLVQKLISPSEDKLSQPTPSKALAKGKKRSYIMLHKKKSRSKKSNKFIAKLHRNLSTYTPMPLKRTLSHASFFPPDLPETRKSSLQKTNAKSTRLRGKISRSTSVPRFDEFDWFISRNIKYGGKIENLREWVRDIWNSWFDQVYPPSDDESSTESISEDLLDTMEDVEEAKELKKSEIKKLPFPDKIPPSLMFFSEDEVEEPEGTIHEVIDDLTKELAHLSDDKVIERACHLTKRGSLYRTMGDIKLASADLDLAIKIEPRIVAAYWQRHLIRLLHHQKHEALDDLNALLKIDPKCVHAYRSRADIYVSLGDYTMAIVNYSQAIKLDPSISDAYYQRANIFEKTGDMLLAMEDYSSVHKLNPIRTDALLKRALYYYTKKSWLVAVSDFTQLIKHEPLNSQARTFRARASAALGNYQSALNDFSAAIHFDPLNSVAYFHRGALLRKAAPDKALQDLSVSLLLDNSERNVLALLHRGILYSETRRYAEALADFEHTLRIDGSIVCAHVNIGVIQMKVNQNYWEAIKRFTSALKHDPTYTRAHMCRADAYALIHDYSKAVKDITRAIHLRPGERHLYLRRGKFLLQLKQLKLAAFCVQHIATLEKSFISSSATQQAVVQSFLGKHEEACESLSTACRSHPVPSMYVLLAKTLMKAERFEDARIHLRHALELTGIYTDEVSKVKNSVSEETRIHFLLGQCGMEMGKHDEALTSYNHALKENSHFAEAFYRRGLCKLKLGMANGIQDLNRALALNPNLFEAYLSRAAYYSTKNRFSKAILNCNEALRLRPLSVRALLCRGALKYRISAYYHAINDLTDAIELDKRCALAYYNRAVCLHKTKAYQRALKDYSIVLVLTENDDSEASKSLSVRVFVNRALLYLCSDINDPSNAAVDLELASKLRSNDTGIIHTIAICCQRMQDLAGAHSAYSRCLRINPSLVAAYVGRGDVYGDAGDFDKAKIEYERALRLDPTSLDAHVHLGYNLHMCGRLHQAWVQFTKALDRDPNCRSALEGRAVTCLHAGDMAAASRDITMAMKCGEPSARILTVRGVVEQSQNDFQSAMAHYNKAQILDPLYTPAHFNAAVLYMRERRFTEALESLQVVIRASPNDSAALLNRAIVRVFLNKPQNAMNDFNYALKLDPENSHLYYNRGNLFFMLKDYENAVKDYSAAFEINPSDYVSLKKRADAKGKLGQKEEAVEDYRLSLDILERHDRLKQLSGK